MEGKEEEVEPGGNDGTGSVGEVVDQVDIEEHPDEAIADSEKGEEGSDEPILILVDQVFALIPGLLYVKRAFLHDEEKDNEHGTDDHDDATNDKHLFGIRRAED